MRAAKQLMSSPSESHTLAENKSLALVNVYAKELSRKNPKKQAVENADESVV